VISAASWCINRIAMTRPTVGDSAGRRARRVAADRLTAERPQSERGRLDCRGARRAGLSRRTMGEGGQNPLPFGILRATAHPLRKASRGYKVKSTTAEPG
jgi:hypothetical protein